MPNSVTFTINFDWNVVVVSKELTKVTCQLQGNVIKLHGLFTNLGAHAVVFNQSIQAVKEFGSGFKDLATAQAGSAELPQIDCCEYVKDTKLKAITTNII